MRIARVSYEGRIRFGLIEGRDVAELDGPPIGDLRLTGVRLPLAECRLLAPVIPSKVVCVSNSYAANRDGRPAPVEPPIFLKPATAVIGPGEPIRKPAVCRRLDHEGELAVVVRGLVRNAAGETAEQAILGYTCANDVTARDLQERDSQWTRAKGFDSFCPLGPWIETALDWEQAEIEVRVNGEVRQQGRAKEMAWSPPALVAYVSSIMTLLPGDVILTGTPPSVGPMEPGDSCEVEISGIGVLANPVA